MKTHFSTTSILCSLAIWCFGAGENKEMSASTNTTTNGGFQVWDKQTNTTDEVVIVHAEDCNLMSGSMKLIQIPPRTVLSVYQKNGEHALVS